MRKIISFMHVSLDMFVGGPNGEMDWIKVDEEIFDAAAAATERADLAIYGRTTFGMMDAYWPTAGDEPGASKHDKVHSAWYNQVDKVVLSTTMEAGGASGASARGKLTVVNHASAIAEFRKKEGGDIVVFGSPRATHALLQEGLIDELWLFVNPVLLGEGIPMFRGVSRTALKLVEERRFVCGVVGLTYVLS